MTAMASMWLMLGVAVSVGAALLYYEYRSHRRKYRKLHRKQFEGLDAILERVPSIGKMERLYHKGSVYANGNGVDMPVDVLGVSAYAIDPRLSHLDLIEHLDAPLEVAQPTVGVRVDKNEGLLTRLHARQLSHMPEYLGNVLGNIETRGTELGADYFSLEEQLRLNCGLLETRVVLTVAYLACGDRQQGSAQHDVL